jgi:hypothetical protein
MLLAVDGVFITFWLLEDGVDLDGVDFFLGEGLCGVVVNVAWLLEREFAGGVSLCSTTEGSVDGVALGGTGNWSCCLVSERGNWHETIKLTSVTGVFPLKRADLRGAIFPRLSDN